ncbi:hypothetical protein CNR34_00022 [Pseudomonas phage nickie]|uniref:Tail terminator n=1 Tax=Pseudomonas phage nickie TaxID=2048977 RepID=A0A2H4P714_9CAUD|nr:hypothetical protein FDJ16_gp143 [Pseudomonas phage nickie]ATW57955.1 hypothetical protein CNR34_00022 [Pseudomonas phage nickie]
MKLESAIVALIQQSGLGIPGKNLFHTHMPAGNAKGILVMARVPVMIDPYTDLRKGTFQVIVRAANILDASGLATQLMPVLTTEGARQGGVRFLFIKPEHDPLVFPRTEGGQFEASVNYNFAANWE